MSWQCTKCGESHEDEFDSCWNCGAGKDGSEPEHAPEAVELPLAIEKLSAKRTITLPCSTTPQIPGRQITESKGIVCGEAIMGANFLRDFVASLTDFVGGRSGVYESKLREGREIALQEMMSEAEELGGTAVVGVDIDYETVGDTMLMVSASGTAVVMEMETVEQGEEADAGNAPE